MKHIKLKESCPRTNNKKRKKKHKCFEWTKWSMRICIMYCCSLLQPQLNHNYSYSVFWCLYFKRCVFKNTHYYVTYNHNIHVLANVKIKMKRSLFSLCVNICVRSFTIHKWNIWTCCLSIQVGQPYYWPINKKYLMRIWIYIYIVKHLLIYNSFHSRLQ